MFTNTAEDYKSINASLDVCVFNKSVVEPSWAKRDYKFKISVAEICVDSELRVRNSEARKNRKNNKKENGAPYIFQLHLLFVGIIYCWAFIAKER